MMNFRQIVVMMAAVTMTLAACSTSQPKETVSPTERAGQVPAEERFDDSGEALEGMYEVTSYRRFRRDCRGESENVSDPRDFIEVTLAEGPEDEDVLELRLCEERSECAGLEQPNAMFWKAMEFGWENIQPIAIPDEHGSQCTLRLFDASLIPTEAGFRIERAMFTGELAIEGEMVCLPAVVAQYRDELSCDEREVLEAERIGETTPEPVETPEENDVPQN